MENNIKAWLHPCLYQMFRVLLVIFSRHTLGPLSTRSWFKHHTCLSVVDNHIHHFMITVYPSSESRFQWNSQITSKWFLEWVLCIQMASTFSRSQSESSPLGWGGKRDLRHGCVPDKSAAIGMLSCQYWPKSQRNVSSTFASRPIFIFNLPFSLPPMSVAKAGKD